jgi:hypothetical protein
MVMRCLWICQILAFNYKEVSFERGKRFGEEYDSLSSASKEKGLEYFAQYFCIRIFLVFATRRLASTVSKTVSKLPAFLDQCHYF